STGYVLADGSGLSRRSLVTPEVLVQTLQGMAKTPAADIYRASLPLAGKSGTLINRLRNTPAEGIVQAKTGTLSGAIALSGYVNSPQYPPLVFSIMVNQSEQPASVLRQAIDEIVVLLAQLRTC
ncbi:D-alanyl-D-alanine carboxypeptidase, partial [Nostoc sp. NIES-2111]